MKKRLTVAALVLAVAALVVIPVLALDIHALLSRENGLLTVSPLVGWAAVVGIPQVGKLYGILTATLGLLLVWIIASGSSLKYRSNMQRVTPDISTPCADGQGQFGTARWLTKNKYGKCFHVRALSEVEGLEELLKAGEQDKVDIDGKR